MKEMGRPPFIHLFSTSEGKYCYDVNTDCIISLSDELYDYIVTISLDGPENIHDKNRRNPLTGEGSFEKVMKNAARLKKLYPEYYNKCVNYNIVLETEQYNVVKEFFEKENLFEESSLSASELADVNKKTTTLKSSSYYADVRYSSFLSFLYLLNRFGDNKKSNFLTPFMILVGEARKKKTGKQRDCLPEKWHHAGPCIPGVMRLFIDVDGKFFPCEKVSEACENMQIGDLTHGYNLSVVEDLLNIERHRNGKCFDCWAYSECKICVGTISCDETTKEMDKRCMNMRYQVEKNMKDYCVLHNLGVDFETGMEGNSPSCQIEGVLSWR